MGASALFKLNFYPLLESTMQTVLARADGGDQPDDSTQQAIIATLAKLVDIENRQTFMAKRLFVNEVGSAGAGKTGLDFARGMAASRVHGRIVANQLARHLGFKQVLADYFSASPPHVPPPIGPDIYT